MKFSNVQQTGITFLGGYLGGLSAFENLTPSVYVSLKPDNLIFFSSISLHRF